MSLPVIELRALRKEEKPNKGIILRYEVYACYYDSDKEEKLFHGSRYECRNFIQDWYKQYKYNSGPYIEVMDLKVGKGANKWPIDSYLINQTVL